MPTPIELFDYELPEELIALKPSLNRDECRLLVLDILQVSYSDRRFKDILDILDDKSFLVVNNTKVRSARLFGEKLTGGKCEFFVTEVFSPDRCSALIKGKLKEGDILKLPEGTAKLLSKDEDGVWLCQVSSDIELIMQKYGHVPLPPYIKRSDDESDKNDYQTVYSKVDGSVAAPTAGLHFTNELIKNLKEKNIEIVEVTLDVGIGTFRPVKTATLEEHQIHKEKYNVDEVAAEKINRLKKAGKRLVAVGSTAVRTLESASSDDGIIQAGSGYSSLYIMPGYKFKIVDDMITNFHLPKSTLLAMVAALGGYELVMKAYLHAIKERYRFYSYGDAMFIKGNELYKFK